MANEQATSGNPAILDQKKAITQNAIDSISSMPSYPTMGSKADPRSVSQAISAYGKLSKAAGIDKVANAEKGVEKAGADYSAGVDQFQKKLGEINAGADHDLATIKSKDAPLPGEFHPIPPKDASLFFSMMMVLGAISGKSTLAPMTAAMNNMSGIMKAQNDHNDEMLAAQKEQFKMNFDRAIEVHKRMLEEKKDILEKANWDMARAQQPLDLLKLKYGQAEDVAKSTMSDYKEQMTAMEKLLENPVGQYLRAESLYDRESNNQFRDQEEMTKRYKADAEKLKVPELLNVTQKIRASLNAGDPALATKIIEQESALLSGIPRNTNAQFKHGMSYGDVIDRLKLGLTKWASGELTATAQKQMLSEIEALEQNAKYSLNQIQNTYNERGNKQWGRGKWNPEPLFPSVSDVGMNNQQPAPTGSDAEAVKAKLRAENGF